MGATENVKRLRAAYQRWHDSRGESVQDWLDLMADEVQFQSLAQGAEGLDFTKPRVSKADLEGYFSGLASDWTMHYYATEHFIAEGDRVAVLGSTKWEHKGTGKAVDTAKADFIRFEDGKIVEFIELYDTAAAIAAATPTEPES